VICISLLIYKPKFTFPGLGIVLLGIPIYYLVWKHKHVVEESPGSEDENMKE
jgi:APA family basic amino acid/polyamine antiporter